MHLKFQNQLLPPTPFNPIATCGSTGRANLIDGPHWANLPITPIDQVSVYPPMGANPINGPHWIYQSNSHERLPRAPDSLHTRAELP